MKITKSQLKQIIKEEIEAALEEGPMGMHRGAPEKSKNISKTSYKDVKGSPEEERAKKCAKAKSDWEYYQTAEFERTRNWVGPDAEAGMHAAETAYYECFPEEKPGSPESMAKRQMDRMKQVAAGGGTTLEEDLYPTKE